MSSASTHVYNAIVQHSNWKVRLKKAVEEGKVWDAYDPSPDHCAFGHWLNENHEMAKTDVHYRASYQIHRDFHENADRIVTLLTHGYKADAKKALEYGEEFDKISQHLVQIILAWHDKLSGKTTQTENDSFIAKMAGM